MFSRGAKHKAKLILNQLFAIIFLLGCYNYSFAALDFEDHAFPELVTSARALAMGNAYISKVDDSWSAFYNPSGLGSVRKPQFHLINAHFEASSGLLDALDKGPATEFPKSYKESFDPQKLRAALAKDQGELAHSRVNLFPNFTVRGMTFGYMFSQRNRAIINEDVANQFEVAERKDHGPVFSLNASLFGGVFKVGATGIYLYRRELYKSFGPTEPMSVSRTDYRTGRSLQVTAGSKITLPIALLPTFSAVLRNTADNNFEGGKDGGLPTPIRQTIDVGFSITPQLGKITRLHLEGNFKDIKNAYRTNAKRRIAIGMELDFSRKFFVRAGSGDGWGSAGLGIRIKQFMLDLSTYAVDRSLEGFREEEDRRWVASFSMGF